MAAFTAHVTIHVHEFSPQILPTLTGMSMRSAALASVSNFRAANRRTVRKPSLLFSLPLGTRRLPVHYFLSEQKKCIFRLCNVVRVKKQGATHDTLAKLSTTPGEDSEEEEERQGGTPQAEEELSPGDHAEALDTGGTALRAYRIKWCSRGGTQRVWDGPTRHLNRVGAQRGFTDRPRVPLLHPLCPALPRSTQQTS